MIDVKKFINSKEIIRCEVTQMVFCSYHEILKGSIGKTSFEEGDRIIQIRILPENLEEIYNSENLADNNNTPVTTKRQLLNEFLVKLSKPIQGYLFRVYTVPIDFYFTDKSAELLELIGSNPIRGKRIDSNHFKDIGIENVLIPFELVEYEDNYN